MVSRFASRFSPRLYSGTLDFFLMAPKLFKIEGKQSRAGQTILVDPKGQTFDANTRIEQGGAAISHAATNSFGWAASLSMSMLSPHTG